ncbi:MAG: hypothetical protein ACI93T_002952 [Porticoccaceae bacterium]
MQLMPKHFDVLSVIQLPLQMFALLPQSVPFRLTCQVTNLSDD